MRVLLTRKMQMITDSAHVGCLFLLFACSLGIICFGVSSSGLADGLERLRANQQEGTKQVARRYMQESIVANIASIRVPGIKLLLSATQQRPILTHSTRLNNRLAVQIFRDRFDACSRIVRLLQLLSRISVEQVSNLVRVFPKNKGHVLP